MGQQTVSNLLQVLAQVNLQLFHHRVVFSVPSHYITLRVHTLIVAIHVLCKCCVAAGIRSFDLVNGQADEGVLEMHTAIKLGKKKLQMLWCIESGKLGRFSTTL